METTLLFTKSMQEIREHHFIKYKSSEQSKVTLRQKTQDRRHTEHYSTNVLIKKPDTRSGLLLDVLLLWDLLFYKRRYNDFRNLSH